jgi:DNA-binding NtrC family response regulator
VKPTSLDAEIKPASATRVRVKKEEAENSSLELSKVTLKILAGALMSRIESLGKHGSTDLNLQREVHRFEAELIRMALVETGGRQRRAARLLGMKATTLSTKIKRHRIPVGAATIDTPAEEPTTPIPDPV